MKIALSQMDIAWLDVPTNLRKIKGEIDSAEAQGARILVLPEMALTGFCMDTQSAGLELKSPEIQELASMTQGKNIIVFAGAAIKRGKYFTNDCLVLRNGEIITTYSKMNLFVVTNEDKHYAPGGKMITLEIDGVRFTPLICFDTRFNRVFNRAAESGTDAFIIMASWPDTTASQWRTLLAARAMDTQSFVIGVNRIGEGDGMKFNGDCMVVAPSGKTMFDYSSDAKLIVLDVDFSYAQKLREKFPVLAEQHEAATKQRHPIPVETLRIKS